MASRAPAFTVYLARVFFPSRRLIVTLASSPTSRFMRPLFVVAGLSLALSSSRAQNSPIHPPDSTAITIHAARMFDGRGMKEDVLVTVRGGRIEHVETNVGARGRGATQDLGAATLLPGLIDAHVHPGWYINRRGALHGRDDDTPAQSAIARAGNLYATLMAGFTTIQSLGGPEDLDLRDAVARWQIPGPRVLTSIMQISDSSLSVDSLHALVRSLKARGADVIKLFGSRPARTPPNPRTPSSRRSAAKRGPKGCARSSTRSAPQACARRHSPAAPRSSTARSRRRPNWN